MFKPINSNRTNSGIIHFCATEAGTRRDCSDVGLHTVVLFVAVACVAVIVVIVSTILLLMLLFQFLFLFLMLMLQLQLLLMAQF